MLHQRGEHWFWWHCCGKLTPDLWSWLLRLQYVETTSNQHHHFHHHDHHLRCHQGHHQCEIAFNTRVEYTALQPPPALITVTVKYINKRTKSLQQLNWNNFSLKRARELDQIAVKSNCHLFLTFIHNPFIKCKAMDDFVKLWSHVVALFVESCFYLLPFLLSVVCRWDWFHLFAVHHLPSTVRDYFHTGCVSFLALFLCISVFLVVYVFWHDWIHLQVMYSQVDRLETIQLLEYQT